MNIMIVGGLLNKIFYLYRLFVGDLFGANIDTVQSYST